ncbi:hypothetical protein JTB14_006608 [Gonioctena quinquepunctata]|nr:hypothetical protein JTB14_006608 [Gonioctena quinquepunctata]
MPDNGDSSDREELQGATGFEEGLTGLRDNPAGGEFLERELGSDDFLAPPEVKAGWIYRLKKPELMELASSLQINPEGTVIELRRRLIWHLSMNRQNTGAVPRRDFSYLPSHQANIPNPWRSSGMIPPTPEESLPTFQGMGLRGMTSTSSVNTHTTTMSGVRSTMTPCVAPGLPVPSPIPTSVSAPLGIHIPTPVPSVPSGVAVGHPGYPIALQTHRWNVKFNGQEEAAAFLERLEEISETENIPKHRLLTALPELFYGKALLWYRSNKCFWNNWETFKETFRMAFYPVHYQEDLELEISRRIQRSSESAIDYIIDLQTLIRYYRNLLPPFKFFRNFGNIYEGATSGTHLLWCPRLWNVKFSSRSELVARCCCVIGLKPIEQAVTQSRQADGSICAITQAFLPKMTIGQEHFEHEILILPHLAVDVVLGMDVLRARGFQIQLTNNKISLTQNTVPTPVAQSVVTLQHLSTEEESRRSSNSHGKENTEGYHFVVQTDHLSLKWVQSIKTPSGRIARWAMYLQQFDFEVRYRKGCLNKVADALSRQPLAGDNVEIGNCVLEPEEGIACPWYRKKIAEVKK